MPEIRKLTKNTKLFYSLDGLDFGDVLAMHKLVKENYDLKRQKRGAKSGRIRHNLPLDPEERVKVETYNKNRPQNNTPFDDDFEFEIPSEKPAKIKPTPKDDTLIKKYEFFLHILISRQVASDNGVAYLNSKILEDVFDKDYLLIKRALLRLGVIVCDDWFELGTKSYGFWLHPDFQDKIRVEQKPIFYPSKSYVQTLNKHLKEQEDTATSQARENLTDDFYTDYLSSLSNLKLTSYKQALSFIDTHFRTQSNSKLYYQYIIGQYLKHDFNIQVPNKRDNRIYHILTSTPRNLKYFLNIRYSVDIHNSHPLLFSSLIYDHYKVPTQYRRLVSLFIREINPLNKVYNVRGKLYNKLLDKGIDYPEIKQMDLDAIKYLYLVSIGKFWDVVIPSLDKVDGKQYSLIRQDVKVIMFAQVFYGKQLSSRGQEYAKVFSKQFPNVYKIILGFKRGLAKNERTVLTHKLMALESKLFREALRRLFANGYRVVSIHDAIVVLDTKENNTCTSDVVKKVLVDVYGEYGLIPDCSVDVYGKQAMEDFMERESFLRERGDEYIRQLREYAATDEDIKLLVEDFDRGKSELILTPDKSDVMLHLRDTKDLMYR